MATPNKPETFVEIINGNTPVLVDFYADWCGPCKTMAPILKDFAAQMGDRVRVIKIDVDKNAKVAETYRIQSIPTLLLFQKGQVKWRQTGVVPKKQLELVVNQLKSESERSG
jgi:thioredoxin 1